MEAKASNKSGTPKYIYTIKSFQNGWIAESEIFCCKRKFICASSTERMRIVKKKTRENTLRSAGQEIYTNFCAYVLAWVLSANFHKTIENPNCHFASHRFKNDHLLGRHVSNGSLHSGDKNMSQDINIFITPYGFCHQKEEV